MTNKTAIGTLLLIGVALLSLNALAVSARPGELSSAETSTTATVAVPQITASGHDEPAVGPIAVPMPPPGLHPTMTVTGRHVATQSLAIQNPTIVAGPGIEPPAANVRQVQGINPGSGIIYPGSTPIPIPPETPGAGKMSPSPVPPYSVDPVHEGL